MARWLVVVLLIMAPAGAAAQSADEAWEAGDLDRARELYAERLAEDSTDVRALHRLALIRGWNEEYAESIALFDRLIELAPGNLDARVARARVHAWKGDIDRGIDQLEAILDQQPRYRPALETLATFRSWQGEYDRALEILDQVAALDPGDRSVHYQRARIMGWADRPADARTVYDSILAEDPTDVRALLGLGQTLSWADRLDSARVVYRRALELDPDNLEARTGLARTAGFSGDLVAAEARWRELVEASPDNADALLGLARTLRWQGRNAAARPYLERVLNRDPGNSDAREQLRWVHAALGPRVAPAFAYEWDSDGNSIYTTSAHAAVHPVPRLEVRVDAYHRSATFEPVVPDARTSRGATLTGQLRLPPGWSLAATAGGAESAAGSDGGVFALVVAAPARYPVRGTFTLRTELLDATALLMANDVTYRQARLDLGTRVGPWTLEGSASSAWFRSPGSDGNRRLAANAAATRPVTPWLDLGPSVRVFGFDRDLLLGYFDPDLFALVEAPASFHTDRGRLEGSVGLVPGLQKITTDGDIEPAFRTSGALAWRQGPGRTVSLSLLWVANGASPFAQQAADYRYFALNLRGRWVF